MSYTSGFFDAIDQGGGSYDRVYSAATFAHYFSLLVKNGVFPDPSTGLQVRASSSPNMQVSVSPGSGWINGYYITVPDNSPEVLTVPTANPSLSRYDSVIMGLNFIDREIQLYIKSGSVSASPSPVTLQRDSDLYELELARISVKAGTASITQSLIIDTRSDSTRCGIVAGMIDQIDTTDLFAQYDDAFQTWFADLQTKLSGDVAASLQNQINQLSIKVDENFEKTLSTETKTLFGLNIDAVPDDAFAMIIGKLAAMATDGSMTVEKITESCTWTAPKTIGQKFRVFAVGGGGSGAGGISTSNIGGGGGGGGYVEVSDLILTEGEQVDIICGAGGIPVSKADGTDGGTTSFGSYLDAAGGKGGKFSESLNGGDGGAGGGGGSSTNGNNAGSCTGGAGGRYGGGGGSGYNNVNLSSANGGIGGEYGGGGGSGPSGTTVASGGTYGGSGGQGTTSPVNGQIARISDKDHAHFTMELTSCAGKNANTSGSGGGGGGGGYGGNGGDGGSYGGGGGGGYGGNGGDGGSYGGGGGGGYGGNGGTTGTSYGGGGGGGLFCNGGNSNSYGGGGGGGIVDGSEGSTQTGGAGGSGGVYILYFKEA